MRLVLLLALTLGLAACAPAESGSTATSAIPTNEQSCRVAGGTWRPVCLMGTPACVIKYADAGQTCRDGDECQGGQCRYTGKPIDAGQDVTGTCVATSDPCGCFALVEDGKVQGALCVD